MGLVYSPLFNKLKIFYYETLKIKNLFKQKVNVIHKEVLLYSVPENLGKRCSINKFPKLVNI